MNERAVHRLRPGHERRIISIPTTVSVRLGDVKRSNSDPTLLAYCTGCAWYQAGDYADIAVAWIAHTGRRRT